MRNHQHTPFTHKEIKSRRQKNIHILLEKARRGNSKAARELREIHGITFYHIEKVKKGGEKTNGDRT